MREMQADVVVIACGPSGLAAAISAAEGGCSVIALEKAINTGGAANMGMGPLGLNTTVQVQELSTVTVDKAFRMFMERTRMVRGLPFPAVLPDTVPLKPSQAQATLDALREEAAGFPEMTLDEINAEISAARAERKARR